ncbi:MAG: hypothetical protein GXP28_10340 [Planctomycetes bacterium]|nr:hypothetical protein [Planctomycetota bacterium]
MAVRILRRAKAAIDAEGIADFLAKDSLEAAIRFLENTEATIQFLPNLQASEARSRQSILTSLT